MAKKKSNRKPEFTIGSEEELQSICRTLVKESDRDFSEESLLSFFDLCTRMDVARHPWADIRYTKHSVNMNYEQERQHSDLVFLWRKEAFKLLCAWLSEETGKVVDVLGSFQSDLFIQRLF